MPTASVNERMTAPFRFAVAKNRSGIRIASIVPSGTWTAQRSSGLRRGSRRSASARLTRRTGMWHSWHDSKNSFS
jgi:hypothetical protein